MTLVGGGVILAAASTNTILQTIVEDRLRGRVLGFFTMAFLGVAPLGNLAAGALARQFGAPATFAFNGLVCAAAGLWFWSPPAGAHRGDAADLQAAGARVRRVTFGARHGRPRVPLARAARRRASRLRGPPFWATTSSIPKAEVRTRGVAFVGFRRRPGSSRFTFQSSKASMTARVFATERAR